MIGVNNKINLEASPIFSKLELTFLGTFSWSQFKTLMNPQVDMHAHLFISVSVYAPVHEDGGSESDTEEGRVSSSPSSSDDDEHQHRRQHPPLHPHHALSAADAPLLLLNNEQLPVDQPEPEPAPPPPHSACVRPLPRVCSDEIIKNLERALADKAKEDVDLSKVVERNDAAAAYKLGECSLFLFCVVGLAFGPNMCCVDA